MIAVISTRLRNRVTGSPSNFVTGCRCYCAQKWSKDKIPPVKKAVIVSTSRDIFTNLAFEDWIYRNQVQRFKENHILMLWTNEPCVVIGRHQNPWAEANVVDIKTMGVQLARRNSGGGTVYHDTGNLNLTFFTPRDHYNRKTNLEFIAKSISEQYGLNVEISCREDLTLRDFKISGTASKLGKSAYHHCTLLIKADIATLKKSLKPAKWDIKTNATRSIKSKTLNLADENPSITIDNLYKTLGINYLTENNVNTEEKFGTITEMNRQFSTEATSYRTDSILEDSLKLQVIDPTDVNFPGLSAIRDEFASWKWIYGRTPKFTSSKGFKIEGKGQAMNKDRQEVQRIIYTKSRTYVVLVKVDVEEGMVTNVNVQVPTNCTDENIHQKLEKAQDVRGSEFSEDILTYLEKIFKDEEDVGLNRQSVQINK